MKNQDNEERMREGIQVNASLSALRTVIQELVEKKTSVISYRNNMLTMLLKDSLGGSAKTLVFINVSPALSSMTRGTSSAEAGTGLGLESLCWGSTLKKVKTNATVSKTGGGKKDEEVDVLRQEVQMWKEQCEELRRRLELQQNQTMDSSKAPGTFKLQNDSQGIDIHPFGVTDNTEESSRTNQFGQKTDNSNRFSTRSLNSNFLN